MDPTELLATDRWWAEFDEAAAGRDLTPDATELILAYRAKRVGMSPTGAVVSIVESRRQAQQEAA